MTNTTEMKNLRIAYFNRESLVLDSVLGHSSNTSNPISLSLRTPLLTNLFSMNFKKLLGLAVLVSVFACFDLSAQSDVPPVPAIPGYHQAWTQLPEDAERHTEVEYAVVDCMDQATLLLVVFNESGKAKSIGLTLSLEEGENSTSVDIASRSYQPGETLRGSCDEVNSLRVPVPAGMDPGKLKVSVTYQ